MVSTTCNATEMPLIPTGRTPHQLINSTFPAHQAEKCVPHRFQDRSERRDTFTVRSRIYSRRWTRRKDEKQAERESERPARGHAVRQKAFFCARRPLPLVSPQSRWTTAPPPMLRRKSSIVVEHSFPLLLLLPMPGEMRMNVYFGPDLGCQVSR